MTNTAAPILEFQGPYRFLSNFWLTDIYYNGRKYRSVEHAFQSAKTFSEDDWDRINYVRSVEIVDGNPRFSCRPTKPGECKRLAGPKADIPITLRPDWEAVKFQILEELIWIKFTNPTLRHQLMATGNAELIEGNTWGDVVYGVCKGVGTNHLGKILMRVRSRIAAGE